MVFQHNVFFRREEQLGRAVQRYLDLLKDALLDEHYLENELRIEYLTACAERKSPVDPVRARAIRPATGRRSSSGSAPRVGPAP